MKPQCGVRSERGEALAHPPRSERTPHSVHFHEQ